MIFFLFSSYFKKCIKLFKNLFVKKIFYVIFFLCEEIIKIFVILCDFFPFSSLFRKRIKLFKYLILFQELLIYMRKN